MPSRALTLGDAIPAHHTLEEIERMAILRTLERTQWNKRATANILGVYRPTLVQQAEEVQPAQEADADRLADQLSACAIDSP